MATFRPDTEFQQLVARIFERHGFAVESQKRVLTDERPRMFEIDLYLDWQQQSRTVVEVKTFRTRRPVLKDLARAAETAAYARAALQADHALLVINLRRDRLPDGDLPGNVILMGFEDLLNLAKGDVDLMSALVDADRELDSALGEFDRAADIEPGREPRDIAPLTFASATTPPVPAALPPRKGKVLADELREVLPGKDTDQTLVATGRQGKNWRLFELVCQDALAYVFEGLLDGWKAQERVGGAAERFDVIAKIRGVDAFCRTLVEDFQTRHVLFEFKNYTGPIKANNLHVTEKYLFPTALRSTVIFVSPQGFGPDAKEAAKGALRDASKLMLDINVDMLTKMLIDKDSSTAPSVAMETLLDGFLQSLGR